MTGVLDKFWLRNKSIIITGGAGLLGQMHAEAIAEVGGNPVIVDLKGQIAKDIAKKISAKYKVDALGVKVNITKKDDVKRLRQAVLEKYGSIDGLINNAANDPKVKSKEKGMDGSQLEFFSPEQWDKDLKVGLTGAFLCSQIVGSEMAKNGKGVILNISSDLGVIAPDQRIYQKKNCTDNKQPKKPVSYSVVKHGLIGLTKYLATYWADAGVRVNALCPGGIYQDQPQEFVEKLTDLIPLGRMAKKEEYKAAVIFLISEASSYMTGSVLVVDGGRSCW